MRSFPVVFLAVFALAGCLTPPITEPLTGDALAERLSGQNLSLVSTDTENRPPANMKLYEDGRVDITYGGADDGQTLWRVEGQGLCLAGRTDPSQYHCRNVVVGAESNHVIIYDTRYAGAERIATGMLSPL